MSDAWRPIETAPEGEWIVVWTGACPNPLEVALYDRRTMQRGWRDADDQPVQFQPTHWMPLAPPEDSNG